MCQFTFIQVATPTIPVTLVAAMICQILRSKGVTRFKIESDGTLHYLGDPDKKLETQAIIEEHFSGIMHKWSNGFAEYVIEKGLTYPGPSRIKRRNVKRIK